MSLIFCSECGKQVSDKAASCPNCGNPIRTAQVLPVYENGKIVKCPKCKSQCIRLASIDTRYTPAEVKTTYKANLNPLKPFTFINKKERVVKKARTTETRTYQCLDCGKEFVVTPSIGEFILVVAIFAIFIMVMTSGG